MVSPGRLIRSRDVGHLIRQRRQLRQCLIGPVASTQKTQRVRYRATYEQVGGYKYLRAVGCEAYEEVRVVTVHASDEMMMMEASMVLVLWLEFIHERLLRVETASGSSNTCRSRGILEG